LFLFLTIFVVSFLRLRQCRIPGWWLWIPLVLSRINDWEIVAIPATVIVMLVLSERNKHASQDLAHLLLTDHDEDANVEKMEHELQRLRKDLELLEDRETICSFGQMAYDGDGVEQDYVQAANWYKIAAEQGSARAQHNLALMYENGEGVPRDLAEAARWYRMAADQGNAGSQNNLATLYENGEGVPQDDTIALDLYRQAAKGGDENAASNVKRLEALLKGPTGNRK
jgi:TPR repeat protein